MGAFQVNVPLTVLASVGLVAATVYSLWMMQKVYYGATTGDVDARGHHRAGAGDHGLPHGSDALAGPLSATGADNLGRCVERRCGNSRRRAGPRP